MSHYYDALPEDARLSPGTHSFVLPDGRKLYLNVQHHAKDHTCVDVWTTRGRAHEGVSRQTGAPERAPMGVMAWLRGSRPMLPCEPDPDSHGWPAVATVSLLWDQTENGTSR